LFMRKVLKVLTNTLYTVRKMNFIDRNTLNNILLQDNMKF